MKQNCILQNANTCTTNSAQLHHKRPHEACNTNKRVASNSQKALIKNARVEVNCWLSYFTCHNFRAAATAAICGWLHATRGALEAAAAAVAVAAANELLSV